MLVAKKLTVPWRTRKMTSSPAIPPSLLQHVKNLPRAVLRGAHLAGAHLAGINLEEADLANADLTAANLIGALTFPVIFWRSKIVQYLTR